MDTQPKYTSDFYGLVAWASVHQKRLLTGAVIVVAVGAIAGIYLWHANSVESSAEAALDRITLLTPAEVSTADAGPYLEVANLYPDTTAAARALLIAGQIQFTKGKFEDAQATFQKFMSSHHDYPLATSATIGIAASLEAQGKTNDAIARYEEVMRHPQDPNTVQAATALGRLYAAQGKAEQALRELASVVQSKQDNTWSMEARIEAQDLLAKHPELQQKMAQAQGAPATAPVTAP